MTAEAPPDLPAGLGDQPAWTPDPRSLADLELLMSGALRPLTGFMSEADVAAVASRGRLADGTPWPAPITLEIPANAVSPEADRLVLHDPEGTPLAVLEITERRLLANDANDARERPASGRRSQQAGTADDPRIRLAGPVTPVRRPEHGPLRAMLRSPADVRAELAGHRVLGIATRRPLHRREIQQASHLAAEMEARLLVLPLIAGRADLVIRPEALVRAVLAARPSMPPGTLIVPVPLAPRETGELYLRAHVAAAYGATHLLAAPRDGAKKTGAPVAGTRPHPPIPLVTAEPWVYDTAEKSWRPAPAIDPRDGVAELSDADVAERLARGTPIPEWFTPPAVARELAAAWPPRRERGVTVFFTGLSGSGKSTVARGLADALAERGDRTVTLLDGDLVRRLLSAGLTFSRPDRALNIRRIGYVATEVTRHGGLAICAPIAPYAAGRAEVREMVGEVGDFLLIYVATPLAVCERRDRKGLYAKARAGLIPEFTGISDPYEPPGDADLVVDTSTVTPDQAIAAVLNLLTSGGWLPDSPTPRPE